MPEAAPALHAGLRLRSRRARASRPRHLKRRLLLAALLLAGLGSFSASSLSAEGLSWSTWTLRVPGVPGSGLAVPVPVTRGATRQEQHYLQQVWPARPSGWPGSG